MKSLHHKLTRYVIQLKKLWKRFFKLKRNRRKTLYASLILLIVLLTGGLFGFGLHAKSQAEVYRHTLTAKQQQLIQLTQKLQDVRTQKTSTESQLKAKEASQAELEKQVKDLNDQLQAKKDKQSLLAKARQVIAPTVYAEPQVVGGCGDNSYAQYIYAHESGCNLTARNAGGCLGIGQACPGSKLTAACPDLSYACQNAFFTDYANSRYGGWAGAYQAWLSKHWW